LLAPETLDAALRGVKKAFLLAGAMELPQAARHFLASARRAGVEHVVLNSSATIALEPSTQIGRWHLEAETILKSSGLKWTMLRPANFASNSLRWAGMIRAQGAVFAPAGAGKTAPIDPCDIGRVAAKALGESGHEGKTYVLTGPVAISVSEQVDEIAQAIGKPLKFVAVPEATARANMLKSGMLPEIMVEAILELIRTDGEETSAYKTTTVEDVTGTPARSFAEWVKDHVGAFR
ncbi:MAG: NAD(P)H-binding protein, partial [Bdellovibrionota bacterium]